MMPSKTYPTSALFHLRPPLGIGLPRATPPSGLSVGGELPVGGTTVSVATYTVHRDPGLFHVPDEYIHDRWLEPRAQEFQNCYSTSHRAGARVWGGISLTLRCRS